VSVSVARREALFVSDSVAFLTTVLATMLATLCRSAAYLIDIIRIPLFPAVLYLMVWITYDVAGRETVGDASVAGFLVIGSIGLITWSSSVWGSGYTIEAERWEGTIAAVFLSPASRIALVIGSGLGSLVFLLPSIAIVAALGAATGARMSVDDRVAVAVSALALVVASLATGMLLAAVYVLSRRANLFANAIQHPLYLLAGFMVPRAELPGWLRVLSDAVPAAHAIDALRASALAGGSLGDVARPLVASFALSALCAALGVLGIRKVEHAAKRSGQLDLY
jgi:ABC-2 type transport system permease protein